MTAGYWSCDVCGHTTLAGRLIRGLNLCGTCAVPVAEAVQGPPAEVRPDWNRALEEMRSRGVLRPRRGRCPWCGRLRELVGRDGDGDACCLPCERLGDG